METFIVKEKKDWFKSLAGGNLPSQKSRNI